MQKRIEHREHAVPADDSVLIAETLTGSEVAFAALMQRYQRLVFRLSYGYCRDRDEALDASQDVFLKVFESLRGYRGEGSFLAW